ncbi:SDR family oxidoreductase [Streptacidiphilus cavernicola]|uniref:SDR family oxidoreductase n=1 Tax=Streptacidiphilus cavernicola TaxID=3342716 RepID=A0ABV6VQS3_9ACTN
MDSPVTVVGGTGRVGRLVVRKLLGRGERVRVVGRSPQRARRHLPAGAEFQQGDVRVAGSLGTALANSSAVVYCVEPGTDERGPDRPETTLHIGVRNVLEAATASGGHPHVVLVSQLHATHHGHPFNAYGRVLDWRLAGEGTVRGSGLPYTVVRPGWLTDGPVAGGGVHLAQGDRGDGRVCRQDVAEACVQALYCPSASGVTFEMFNEPGPAAPSWERLFAALEWDLAPVG